MGRHLRYPWRHTSSRRALKVTPVTEDRPERESIITGKQILTDWSVSYSALTFAREVALMVTLPTNAKQEPHGHSRVQPFAPGMLGDPTRCTAPCASKPHSGAR
jgi:hypothetical protein